MEDLQCKQLKCERIVVSAPESKYRVLVEATKTGVGIWITGREGGPSVCICNGFDQGAQVAVRSGREHAPGHDIGLQADAQTGHVQLVTKENQPIVVTVNELFDILTDLRR